MPIKSRKILISPWRNEAVFMRQTLESVVEQPLKPAKWVIVDDAPTDETPAILAEYASRHGGMSIVTCADRGHRAAGPGVRKPYALRGSGDNVGLDQERRIAKSEI